MSLDPALTGLAGTLLGWVLSQFTAYFRRRDERRTKLQEQLLANYAEWLTGIKAHFTAYATQAKASASPTKYDIALCEQRLLLLETDEHARTLIRAVWDAIPDSESEDYRVLSAGAVYSGSLEWPPFDNAILALVRHVRTLVQK